MPFTPAELPFLFQNVGAMREANLATRPKGHVLASNIGGAWAAFAKTGSPNHVGIPKWEAYNDNVPTMVFDTVCSLKNDPDGDLRKAILEAQS